MSAPLAKPGTGWVCSSQKVYAQSALFNHSQEEMSFPQRKSMFYPHPEKSARLDEICSLSSVCEPRGMVSELSYPISSFSPNEMFTKNDSSPSFRTFSVKQRKPSLVRLPSVPVCHLGFLPLSPAEVGWLWEHRERGALSSLAHHTNYSWSFQVFSSPYMFCSSVYIHTDTCVSIHAHTPTLDTYSCIYTHFYGDLGPSESASDSFLPCLCISINKRTTPTSFPAK